MNNGLPEKRKKSSGLIIIGSILIIGALIHMNALTNHEWYKYCVAYLPPALISIRYVISWAQRFWGVIAGVGLMAHRRWAANMAIYLSIFNILSVYWKYPYQSFQNQSIVWDERWGGMFAGFGYPRVHFSSYVLPTVCTAYVLDFLFFGFTIYYLSRPDIQKKLI